MLTLFGETSHHFSKSREKLEVGQLPHLQTGIGLGEGAGRGIGPPGIAVVVEGVPVDGRDRVTEIDGALEEVNRQTVRHVPGDMAVHEPGAGVVGLEGDDDPPARGEHGDVTAHGVLSAQTEDVLRLVEDIASLGSRGGIGRAAEDDKLWKR